jgi:L-ascorbate metabolism protein UlaG (beta-lactamase superfamily)
MRRGPVSILVALIPCGGTYTMTAAEMAEAADGFSRKVLIPMHWGDSAGSKANADAVKQSFTGTTVIKSPGGG